MPLQKKVQSSQFHDFQSEQFESEENAQASEHFECPGNDTTSAAAEGSRQCNSEGYIEENSFKSDEEDGDPTPLTITCNTKRKMHVIADSDSEEEGNQIVSRASDNDGLAGTNEPVNEKIHKRLLAVVDSDSDAEIDADAGFTCDKSDDSNKKEQPVFTTNSKGELLPEDAYQNSSTVTRLISLCDPESSEDDAETGKYEESIEREIGPTKYKRKSKPSSKPKPKKMTSKDAANLRQEIKSESQRMLREKNVSLPYHKPKSFTLKEFLSRRPKFASAVPATAKAPPSVAIKMSEEQLSLVSKKLKEREKELKQFYKSESESEGDPDDKDYIPPSESDINGDEDNTESLKDINLEMTIINPPVTVSENQDEVSVEQSLEADTTIGHEGKDNISDRNEILSKDSTGISIEDIDFSVQNNAVPDENKESDIPPTLSENITMPCYDENNDKENDIPLTLVENLTMICDNKDATQPIIAESTSKVVKHIHVISDIKITSGKDRDAVTVDGKECELSTEVPGAITVDEWKEEIPVQIEQDCQSVCVQNTEENNSSSQLLETDKEQQQSMDYEFNLDGLEENSESVIEKESAQRNSSRYELSDLDKEIQSFGLDDNARLPIDGLSHQSKNLSKLDLVKEHIANIQPRLSGGPDEVIDLESGIAKPNEVTKLQERFLEHNFRKPTHKDRIQLSIISIESGEIHKETVAMKLDDENEAMVIEEKPGAKLQKLRNELQSQMAQKRSEMWQKKSTQELSRENKPEKEQDDAVNDDYLDDEEEEIEISESSEEEDPDEEIENYTDCKPKKKKSAFIDEEAEESIDEGDQEETDNKQEKKTSAFIDEEADESDKDDDISQAASENEVADEDDGADLSDTGLGEDTTLNKSPNAENSETQPPKKSFKKILKGFTEDSDEEDVEFPLKLVSGQKKELTPSQDDEDIPPHQPQSGPTQIRQITQNKSDFEFLTPISYISGLQNLTDSSSKFLKDSPIRPFFQKANEPSPLKERNWERTFQEKLSMGTELTDSQVLEDLSPDTQVAKASDSTNGDLLSSDKFPSTQENVELVPLCSGITQDESAENPKDIENASHPSNDFIDNYTLNPCNKEMKSLDEDQDIIISQLIDEEEMERFKKKFESPLIGSTQRRIVEEFEEAMASGGVIDSDDEADTVEVKRKNKKRLQFSDDDDSEADDNNEEEVIDLHDNVEDDASDVDVNDVAYDSEENEIELTDGEGEADAKLKPSDFLEDEAELSESDWDSADEDEKDLDTMEFEQGDDEKFDEKQIRSDLEKIHMRRLLDDDTREVKLLQEMLLEDGELHGTGRERQFRWKNIDSITAEEDDGKKDEDDTYLDEEESEEQWRRRRYEREMFFKEKLKKTRQLDEELLCESQILKIGQKVVQKSQSNSQSNTPKDTTNTPSSPVAKQPFSLLNKRGSFLSRGDEVLQRLAEYNKVTSVTVGTAKNSRNFLFQRITVESQSSVTSNQEKKRKASDGTPKVIKKLRLTENLSPAVKKEAERQG
ncbi:hypothetical protein NQ315_009472 [Exocentrus adspersus]|uniref:Claspin n=1 Tax=Exocentrus adspersus TaxID=1586481 RepID=A0AAV8WGB9_9CUCU|nr:hypothetical protein NQ315_009472 [Exocentrus adspersus]